MKQKCTNFKTSTAKLTLSKQLYWHLRDGVEAPSTADISLSTLIIAAAADTVLQPFWQFTLRYW